ncbi:ABC transporter permease [Kocuria sp.]|jgi:ABC-2 type transport system permease protein|uniref:ABC transporter permease n=1 Tax=Kocuria sp. TaxID=1871328 RepID=UPI002812132A|nr:ABC transporter permease [Kocuria sp.]
MGRHNLSTVVGFELTRTVRKRGFWIATLAIPVVIAIIFALSFTANTSISDSEEAQKDAQVSFAYTDASGLIPAELAGAFGGTPATDPDAALEQVKAGELDAYFAYPGDPAAAPIEVTGADRGLFDNGAYDAVAQSLLTTAAQQEIGDPALAAAAAGDLRVEATIYRAGEATGGFNDAVAPLLLLVVFILVIMLLSNQMLSSTLEEKENRVTEMVLTTVDPTTLILGKIVALFGVGLVQVLVFLAPVVAGYLFFRDRLAIPEVDLSEVQVDAPTMVVAVLLLVGGFVLVTGVLVAIGAIMPTAKDAGVVFGPLIFAMFVPFYIVSLIISDPQALIVQVFTYFPLTAPVTAMLRNALGTLEPWAAGVVIAELFVLGAVVLRVAVHLFRHGSTAYTDKLDLRAALGRTRRVRAGR